MTCPEEQRLNMTVKEIVRNVVSDAFMLPFHEIDESRSHFRCHLVAYVDELAEMPIECSA